MKIPIALSLTLIATLTAADPGREAADRLALRGIDLLAGTDRTQERLDEGLALLRQASDQGSPIGAFHLAVAAEQGLRQTASATAAMVWYRRAADLGSADATFLVGNRYFKGLGVEKDDQQARAWYEKAVLRGNGTAALHLALMQRRGLAGLPNDPVQCLTWLYIARALGEQDVAGMIKRLEPDLSADGRADATARADAFLATNHLRKDTP